MKAVFHKDFRFDRPKSKHCFDIKASPYPQSWPRDIIKAAIADGAAEEFGGNRAVKPARKGQKKQAKTCKPSGPNRPYDGDLL